MPYNTKSLKYDLATKPIPQHFNERIDDYEPLLGDHGASRALLYGANGQPLFAEANPGHVVISSNIMELYGATADDRPAANSVRVGTYFTEVDSQQVWQSNGTEWIAVHTIMAIDGQLVRRVS